MPFFSQRIEGDQILIDVRILQPGDNIREKMDSVQHAFKALVDTGAMRTFISPRVVAKLGLMSEGKISVISATEKTAANLYHVDFHIPITKILDMTRVGNKIKGRQQVSLHSFMGLEVGEFAQPPSENIRYDVLLGMDVLMQCSLFISSNPAGPFITFCY